MRGCIGTMLVGCFTNPPMITSLFALLYDDSSLANFVNLFINNRIDELFVEYNPPMVEEEGIDVPLVTWQEPAVTFEEDVGFQSETVSESSDTNNSQSSTQDMGQKSSEGVGCESRATNMVEVTDR